MYLNYNYFNKLDEYTLLTVPYRHSRILYAFTCFQGIYFCDWRIGMHHNVLSS